MQQTRKKTKIEQEQELPKRKSKSKYKRKTIEGYCEDCRFLRQEPLVIKSMLDIAWYCTMADAYKQPHGYCDFFTPKDLS